MRSMFGKAATVAVLGTSISFSMPALAVIPLSGAVGVTVNAGVGNAPPALADSSMVSWLGVPTGMTTATSVFAGNVVTGGVSSFGTARALWTSANAGFAGLGVGWSFSLQPGAGGGFANNAADPKNWIYSFQTTGPATFNLTYSVSAFGSPFGLHGWNLFEGANQLTNLTNGSDPTTAGTFSHAIGGPGVYTFSLQNGANISAGDLNDYSGQMSGEFSWEIVENFGAVPEPATWAMMILGFGLIGAQMRRRNPVTATA